MTQRVEAAVQSDPGVIPPSAQLIAQLARECSIEINVQDVSLLAPSRAPGLAYTAGSVIA